MHRITADIVMLMVGATAAATAGELSGLNHHLVITLWCIAGGCLGALCSLHYFRIIAKPLANIPGETTRQYAKRKAAADRELAWDVIWQFGTNFAVSAVASPFLVPRVSSLLGFPEGMNTALLTSMCVGATAQQIVKRWVIPIGKRWLEAKASHVQAWAGIAAQEKGSEDRK